MVESDGPPVRVELFHVHFHPLIFQFLYHRESLSREGFIALHYIHLIKFYAGPLKGLRDRIGQGDARILNGEAAPCIPSLDSIEFSHDSP